MKESRTINSIRNMGFGLFTQLIMTFLKFVLQTIFIKILGSEYLGLNGLFTNILTMLSFAELGIGNAIIFSMYKPISENDDNKIKSLMKLYKKCYIIIGCFIFLIGLAIIPFMDLLIKDVPNVKEKIVYIYILFLTNTAISYFFTYKKSIIIANQKNFIVDLNTLIFFILRVIFQCIILVTTRNYILYLIIQIVCTVLENVKISRKANKLYPILNDNDTVDLPKKEMKDIFANVKSLVIYKFGSVTLNGTDNILISSIISTELIGIISNYTLIINSINSIIVQVLSSITASIGNLNATVYNDKKQSVFLQIFLISFYIYAITSTELLILLNPFIELWLGKEFLLSFSVVVVLIFNYFIDGIRFAGYTYRTTLGLFKKGKYIPLIAAIINIVLSIMLGKIIGLIGILIATIIARLMTTVWFDPYLIYKYEFKQNAKIFYKKYIKYIIIFVINLSLNNFIITKITLNGLCGLLVKGFSCLLLSCIIILLFTIKSKEFKEIFNRYKNLKNNLKEE